METDDTQLETLTTISQPQKDILKGEDLDTVGQIRRLTPDAWEKLTKLINTNTLSVLSSLRGNQPPGPTTDLRRIKKRRYIESQIVLSDGKQIKVPQWFADVWNNPKYVPGEINSTVDKNGWMKLSNLGQIPKQLEVEKRLLVTSQMMDLWKEIETHNAGKCLKLVLSGPMGIGKSFILYYLVTMALDKKWKVLYIAEATEWTLAPDPELYLLDVFISLNKKSMTAEDISAICDCEEPSLAIYELLTSNTTNTLIAIDEHGELLKYSTEPIYMKLLQLQSWTDTSARRTHLVLSGSGHGTFEVRYLKDGMREHLRFITPLNKEEFVALMKEEIPITIQQRVLYILTLVIRITNRVPRELRRLLELVKKENITAQNAEEILRGYENNRKREFFQEAMKFYNRCTELEKSIYRSNLKDMLLPHSGLTKSTDGFFAEFVDLGLVYREKICGVPQYFFLCHAAANALLDLYLGMPLPNDLVALLMENSMTGEQFEEIVFQQLMRYRHGVNISTTDLNGGWKEQIRIEFENYYVLKHGEQAPDFDTKNFLIRGHGNYPAFDFFVNGIFIQISLQNFVQHNRDTAAIELAFDSAKRNWGTASHPKNQVECFLDTIYQTNGHKAKIQNGKIEVKDPKNQNMPQIKFVFFSWTQDHHKLKVKELSNVRLAGRNYLLKSLFVNFADRLKVTSGGFTQKD